MRRGTRTVLLGTLALALTFLGVARPPTAGQQPADMDEKTLQNAGIPTDTAGLLDFFHKRSLKDADRKAIEALVKKLDDRSFTVRTRARDDLILRGPVALPFLKRAMKTGSLEFVRLAQKCLEKIEVGAGPERPAAAARLLAARRFEGPARAREAVEVLLDYTPFAGDEWLEEEVLRAAGALAARQGQLDLLAAALKDRRPERRAAAGYALARRGTLEHRRLVRQLLQDPEPAVQARVAAGLAGRRALPDARAAADADAAHLRTAGVGSGGEQLVEFFARRTLDEKAQAHLQQLIRQLGDRSWSAREKATRQLIEQGVPAVPFLKQASENDGPEVALRAWRCIQKIKQGPGAELPIAAARLLARAGEPAPGKPAGEPKPAPGAVTPARALQALLAYAPFADDESVEQEVLGCLTLLSVRDARIDPVLVSALHDPLPPRRAAAAHVLGRVGTREDCEAVRKLLADPVPKVRLRAAEGLLAAGDRAAVPVLIDLLDKAPDSWAWRVEELLHRVAGDKGPELPPGDDLAGARKKAAAAWSAWWSANEVQVDLARAAQEDQRLGLTLIVEYDSSVGGRQGKIWECGRDGKPRWQMQNLFGPMDAQVLPNGRVLVAESNAARVSERDLATGNIVWQHSVGNPVVCQRLPNGNTFIATYNTLLELDPTRKVVFSHNLGPNFFVFGAQKLRTGNIVCMTSQGMLIEFDPAARKNVRTINVGVQGNWCGVDVLPNGRYLVALLAVGEIREIDAKGTVHWRCAFPGAFRATRLPNGNTLAVSMTSRVVAEFDRGGRRVWEHTCQGRPWQAHTR
jgi:HEAT repeat protein